MDTDIFIIFITALFFIFLFLSIASIEGKDPEVSSVHSVYAEVREDRVCFYPEELMRISSEPEK